MRGTHAAVLGAVLLASCSASPPRPSIWEAIPPQSETPPTEPLELPPFPTVQEAPDGISIEDAQAVLIYIETAEANTEIAWEHADQVAELRTAVDAMARAGQAEHDIAELRLQTLEDERRSHFFSRITDWILIVVLGIAAAR